MYDVNKNLELSKYRFSSAEQTYQNAKLCLDNGFYRDCINRSYYAAFYAIKSVLALESVDFKRHKDVVAYFNKEYVATEKFPKELGRKLARLKDAREESDYDDFYIATYEDAKTQFETVQLILLSIKDYLCTKGVLKQS